MSSGISILRNKRRYSPPGKDVQWRLDATRLVLQAVIRKDVAFDTSRFDTLGKSPSWRIVPNGEDNLRLTCQWDIRLVMPVKFQSITSMVENAAVDIKLTP